MTINRNEKKPEHKNIEVAQTNENIGEKIRHNSSEIRKDAKDSLEKKADSVKKVVDEEKEVIEHIISEIKVSEYYKKEEKQLKKKDLDEKDAEELGFKPDNYYSSAKSKEDGENDLTMDIEGSSGSIGGMATPR